METLSRSSSSQHQQPTVENRWKRLSDKYDANERPRLNYFKKELGYGVLPDRPERNRRPSNLQKIGRLVLDAMGIKFKKIENSRNQEAKAEAIRELREESAMRELIDAQERRDRDIELEIEQDRQALRDFRQLEREMADGHDMARRRRAQQFHTERQQEFLERDLNDRLLTIDGLEEAVIEGGELDKRIIEYDGTQIPIYDLNGLPFCALVHNIEYRLVQGKETPSTSIGVQTALELRDNPSLWAQQIDEAKGSAGFATRNPEARGNVISTSYINSESNLDSYYHHRPGDVIYGFEYVDAGSVLTTANGDGGTANMVESPDEFLSYYGLRTLEGANSTNIYNEILLKRYSETGKPKLPDYIVATDGEVSEKMLKHAKFFGIPIVNVNRKNYVDQQWQRGQQAISEIIELDDFAEMEEKYLEAQSLTSFRDTLKPMNTIGLTTDARLHREIFGEGEDGTTRFDAMKRLQQKRLDFYKKTLQDEIKKMRKAPNDGHGWYSDTYVQFIDRRNGKYVDSYCPEKIHHNAHYLDDGTNEIRIRMPFHSKKYGKVTLEDVICDGARPTNGGPKPGADSNYYDEFEPIVKQYLQELYNKLYDETKTPK